MRILITGARGFIGAALASEAAARGHELIAVDLPGAGRPLPDGVTAIEGDITCPDTWRAAFADVEVVVHSAAMHHADRIAAGPARSIEVNLRGTRLMLTTAAASGVRTFIHLSSAKVYGEPLSFPSGEDDLLNPVEPYGLAKAVSEGYCSYFGARSDMHCVSVRPFSVYGPGQDLTTGYIGQLIQGWLSRSQVTLSGRPDFLRDFVHVDDVVEVCLALLGEPDPVAVVNAGSGHATSLRDLVSEFAVLCDDSIDVRYTPARPGTIERTLADVSRQFSLMHRPPVALRAGLRQTLDSFGPRGSAVA